MMEGPVSCQMCGNDQSLKRCGKCKKVWYCSVKCQRAAWVLHKQICGKPIRQVLEERGAFAVEPIANDPNRFYIVCMAERPGAIEFCQTLERTLYPFGTAANDNFEIKERVWQSTTMMWFVICIPIGDADAAKRIALACGMRVADGIPKMLQRGENGVAREDWFPIVAGPNVWTLENGARRDLLVAK